VVGRTGRDKQDREVVADGADLTDRGLGAFENATELLAAVTVLEDADARSIEIEERTLGLAQDCFRQCGGA